jgi:hypothetical protein
MLPSQLFCRFRQRVRQDLLKSDLHETLLSGSRVGTNEYESNVLDAVAAWLRPVDRRSLPLLRLRTTLFQCLDQLPGVWTRASAFVVLPGECDVCAAEVDHLKRANGIGALLMEFRDRPDEVMCCCSPQREVFSIPCACACFPPTPGDRRWKTRGCWTKSSAVGCA